MSRGSGTDGILQWIAGLFVLALLMGGAQVGAMIGGGFGNAVGTVIGGVLGAAVVFGFIAWWFYGTESASVL